MDVIVKQLMCVFLTSSLWLVTLGRCPEDSFDCDNGRCVSLDKVCNDFDDCKDQSDENDCEGVPREADDTNAVTRAANYLSAARDPNLNWHDFTPRAIVALSLAKKLEKERAIAKIHDEQLLLLLHEKVDSVPLHVLSLHINALYAMCKDPRQFHGVNLVDLLRSRTDKAIGASGFNKPIALLTLCLSKSSRFEDFEVLMKLYDKRIQTTAIKALILITMSACNRQVETHGYKVRLNDFVGKLNEDNISSIGSYTLGLIIQALNAWGYKTPLKNDLLLQQKQDGSFQDLLGTYAAIPALMGASLADIRCQTLNEPEKPRQTTAMAVFSPSKFLLYSLNIATGQNIGRHTLSLSFEGRTSLFQLMKMAEKLNNIFSFFYEQEGTDKKVTSMAGVTNDAESGSTWTLYKTEMTGSSYKDIAQLANIEAIFPEDGDHYVWQFEEV